MTQPIEMKVFNMSHETLPALLNKTELCQRFSLSPRALEYLVKRGEFPPPVRIGKYVYWSELAISNWQRTKFARQEAWEESF